MSDETLLKTYYFMRLTRAMEDRTRTLFLQGKVVGGVYTAQGHEATTVGAAMTLRHDDFIVPQHRDLGMHLVRGGSPRAVMCQWLARGNSPTLGRDGQMHIGDMHHGIVPMISMLGESLPDLTWIRFDGCAVARRDSEGLHRHAARVQHPEDVVVRDDEERGGFGERRVVGEERGLDVSVRTDEGELAGLVIERPCDSPKRWIGIEKPVVVEDERMMDSAPHGTLGGVDTFKTDRICSN